MLFYAIPHATYPMGRDVLVVSRGGDAPWQIDGLASRVLARCEGARTLEEHGATVWASSVSADPVAVADAINRLVDCGLLCPLSDVGARTIGDGTPPVPIRDVVVITADRPHRLKRCLESIAREAAKDARSLRITVVDGSRVKACESEAVARTAIATDAGFVSYIGEAQVEELKHLLCDSGVPRHVLDAAVTPGEIGRNRNLSLLATAGSPFITVDDDVDPTPRAAGEPANRLTIFGHRDPRPWRFFKSRDLAIRETRPVETTLLGMHETVLDRSLADLLAAHRLSADLRDACPHMLTAVRTGERKSVRITCAGLVGDSGRYCSHRVLFDAGPAGRELRRGTEAFRTALSSREILRIAPSLVIGHEPICMGYCMGVSNRTLPPPFVPIGRNEDGMFAAMVAFMDDAALFAHLPFGVIHDSDRPSMYTDDAMLSVKAPRVTELIGFVLRGLAGAAAPGDAEVRLASIGGALRNAANLPLAQFRQLATEAVYRSRSIDIDSLANHMLRDGSLGEHWHAALEEYRSGLLANIEDPSFIVPIECRGGTPEDGLRRTQARMGDFADVIAFWPDMWRTASAAREQFCLALG